MASRTRFQRLLFLVCAARAIQLQKHQSFTAALEDKAAIPCSSNIKYTITTTSSSLCVDGSGQVEYTGETCGMNKILWTSATNPNPRSGLTQSQCTWDWTTHAGQAHYGGSCGVAPAVDGGDQLPTSCQYIKLPMCLFLHGAMVKGPWPPQFRTWYGDVGGSLRTYWGPFNDWYADLCGELIYSDADTETHAWNNIELQQHYVDKATEVIAIGGVVFGHSMANAILAGACWMLNKCVQWYSLGGGYSGQAVGNGVSAALQRIGPVGSNLMNMKVYDGFNLEGHGMRYDLNSDSKNAMAKIVDSKKLLKGSICGISPRGGFWQGGAQAPDWGLDFSAALKLELLYDHAIMGGAMTAASLIVDGELEKRGASDMRSDGLVEVAACAYWEDNGGRHWYGTGSEWPTVGPMDDPNHTHILAKINHIEECGVFPEVPVAANWIRNMMCRELQLRGGECPSHSVAFEWPAPSGQIGEACLWPNHRCNDGHCCTSKGHSMCQNMQKDWLGLEYCPAECQGFLGFPGTCENEEYTSLAHRPRKLGEPCLFDSDCEDWVSAHPNGCCGHVCTQKEKDYVGLYWCPSDCKGSLFGPPGSC